MGRPRKVIVKSEIVKVRYTSAEKRLLVSFSQGVGKSVSEFVRDKSLDHKQTARLTDGEVLLLRGLIGMANNLNQIAKKVHLGEASAMMISELILAIHEQIRKLK